MTCLARILQKQWRKYRSHCHGSAESRKSIYRLGGVLKGLFISLAFLFQCEAPSLAEPFKFDSGACKHNTGKLYVALGRYVFATSSPTEANLVIDPIPASKQLKAPDPNDPVGCLGNPLQSNSHALLHSMPGENKSLFPDLLTLYNLRRGSPATNEKDEGWIAEASARDIAASSCRTASLREELVSGLLACRIKPVNPPNVAPEDWAASYMSPSEGYKTPLGRPFIVNCGPGLFSRGIGHCDVAYAVNSSVGVSYRFQPYRSSHPIPIEQIVAFDKSLRLAIEEAQVKDYPWPD